MNWRRHLCSSSLRGAPTTRSSTAAAALSSEAAATSSLAAGAGGLIATTVATASSTTSAGGIVVATSVCVGLGAALLHHDALAINGVWVGGNSGNISGLGLEFDKCAVLQSKIS